MKAASFVTFLSITFCYPGMVHAQTLDWIDQFGTSEDERGRSISADGLGNVYISGSTAGSLEGTNPKPGRTDAFLSKYDANGTLLWSDQFDSWTDQFGPGMSDHSYGVSADGLGNVYISGSAGGSLEGTNASLGSIDAFLRKYDANGTVLWTDQFGTSETDRSIGVSADGLGNVYISGYTYGSLEGTNPNLGSGDAFLRKYDASGTVQWTDQFGTSVYERGTGVSADGLGNVYISGYTYGSLEGTNAGPKDVFLRKYDASGTVQWTDQFGTSETDYGRGVSADGLGNVYISGYTEGSLEGTNPNPGTNDAFLRKYDASGTILWTDQFGTSEGAASFGVSADGLGNVYISGATKGSLEGTNPNPGTLDALLRKYDASGTLLWTEQFGTSEPDFSLGVSADGLGNVYISGATKGSLEGTDPNPGTLDAFIAKYSASASGDYNGSGEVEQGDLDLVLLNWGEPWPPEVAGWVNDRPTDDKIDQDDLDKVLLHWGDVASTASVAVPEPHVVLLCLTGLFGGLMLRRRNISTTGLVTLIVLMFFSPSPARGQTLDWIDQFGTSEMDTCQGVSADGLGNVYISGNTKGSLEGTNPNPGTRDAYLSKYDASGTLLWTDQFGTSESDSSYGVSADGLGNVYISGWTEGSVEGTNPNPGARDAYLSKYDASGTLQWIEQFGTSESDQGQSVSADGLGNVYISGYTFGSLEGTNAGGADAFLRKYDANGAIQWTEQFGTDNFDYSNGVSADGLGNVYISGWTKGSLEGANAGGYDAFLRKYDANGEIQWTEQFGTDNDDHSDGVSVDGLGNVYIAGWTRGSLEGTNPNPGTSDAYLSKYDANGTLLWIDQLGTSESETSRGVSADGLGNVYISGYTRGKLEGRNAGGGDAFLSKYDANGVWQWGRQPGTSEDDWGRSVSADGQGNVYLSGSTNGGFGSANVGIRDAFLTKFTDESLYVTGDYNASGEVEQSDLDLVLLNWGGDSDVTGIPEGWVQQLPNDPSNRSTVIDQEDLDAVLLHWGDGASTASVAVPEPMWATVWSLLCGLAVAIRSHGRKQT